MAKQSKRTQNAIALVNSGLSRYRAALIANVSLSTIYAAYPIGSTNHSTIEPLIRYIADPVASGLKSN